MCAGSSKSVKMHKFAAKAWP